MARERTITGAWVLAATILGSAMAFIDGSVVTIALPALGREFGAGIAALQWVSNGYMLFLATLILVGGAAGDRFGRRRLFLCGIVVFAIASAAAALAPSIALLIAARAVQGAGAAMLVPQSLAILSAAFPPETRGRAIGTWAGASAITTALGPAVGGVLIDALGWRAAFWINLPLALVAVLIARARVPESRAVVAGPLDWPGAALATLASGCATLGLTLLAAPGGSRGQAAALIVGAVLAATGFVRVERRAVAPLVPPGLFGSRVFTGANLLTLFLYGALAGTMFLLPFELIGRRGMSAATVGAVLMPLGIIIGLFARRAGALADRIGPRWPLIVGSAAVAIASLLLGVTLPGLVPGVLMPVLTLAGGMALVVAPLTTSVMNAAPDALSGAASGVNNAASRLAGLFAVALVGAVAALVFGGAGGAQFGSFPDPAAPEAAAVAAAFDRAYRAGMLTCAVLAALASAAAAWTFRPET